MSQPPSSPSDRAHHEPGPPSGSRRGIGPIVLLVPLLAACLAIVYLRRNPFASDPLGAAPEVSSEGPARVAGFRGQLERDGLRLTATLLPFHVDPRRAELYADGLARRGPQAAGRPWRLALELVSVAPVPPEPTPAEPDAGAETEQATAQQGTTVGPVSSWELGSLSVRDDGGVAQTSPRFESPGPLEVLLARVPTSIAVGTRTTVALWGREPRGSIELVLGGAPGVLALEPREFDRASFEEALLVAQDGLGRAIALEPALLGDPRDLEIAHLRDALQTERSGRQDRELEWFEYNRAIANLRLDQAGVAPFPVDEAYQPDSAGSTGESDGNAEAESVDPARVRAEKIALSLGTLLKREDVYSIDLIDPGVLGLGFIGPVVFRILDDRGRLSGSLYAERLRLEASRSARMLTLVLEQGYESHRGERTPFRSGMRRIGLPFVDPEPWLRELPELFEDEQLAGPLDDGLWQVEELRLALNELLGHDISTGWYRLRALGGVFGDALTDVHLEVFSADGRIQRHLFADRMFLRIDAPGVEIVLEDGASIRGDTKTPFLEGRHRVFLPHAPLDAWRAEELPLLGQEGRSGAPEANGAREAPGATEASSGG